MLCLGLLKEMLEELLLLSLLGLLFIVLFLLHVLVVLDSQVLEFLYFFLSDLLSLFKPEVDDFLLSLFPLHLLSLKLVSLVESFLVPGDLLELGPVSGLLLTPVLFLGIVLLLHYLVELLLLALGLNYRLSFFSNESLYLVVDLLSLLFVLFACLLLSLVFAPDLILQVDQIFLLFLDYLFSFEFQFSLVLNLSLKHFSLDFCLEGLFLYGPDLFFCQLSGSFLGYI